MSVVFGVKGCVRVVAAAWLLFVPAMANAQPARWSVDASTGFAVPWRDVYNDRVAVAADALVSRSISDTPLRWGAGVSAFASVKFNDSCTLNASMQCRTDIPSVSGATVFVGSELLPGDRAGRWSIRAMVGPGIFRASTSRSLSTIGGATGRIDLAFPFGGGVTMIATSRTTFLPALTAQGRGAHAFGLGMRIQ